LLSTDVVVIGAGVVGLACAKKIAETGREVIVLEAAKTFGEGVSSRNSEVIHAGIYYKPGSYKARLCRRGRDMLYEYLHSRQLEHHKTGKWIVATNDEQDIKLQAIYQNALENGVNDLRWVDRNEFSVSEPELYATRVLESPSTGILDVHQFMVSLIADIECNSGVLVYNSLVLGGQPGKSGIEVQVGGASECSIFAETVINSAGLNATSVARSLGAGSIPPTPIDGYAKGNYFTLMGANHQKLLI
jgi:L-2-hydroxyglutarate oxidase LhgO